MEDVSVFFMKSFDIVHGITLCWQKSNCGTFVENAYQFPGLFTIDTVACANVILEITTFYTVEPVFAHPYVKGVFPVEKYAVDIS
jgi:hypothetical protein